MFAEGFYAALLAGRPYRLAFKFGRSAIDLHGIPEHLTPVLKMKRPTTAAPLLSPSPPGEKVPPPAAPVARRRPGPVSRSASLAPKIASAALDRSEVRKATEALAHYIGPYAYAIAREREAEARDLRHFYKLLAGEIEAEEQRNEFLRLRPR